ncbi:hypothetical protein PaG_03215 [Moesziomyces aphidis]|uniref:Uncharacterized protein n=1 Tax=Moesziomyces aphidis TaxID=84754 RepID=W3VLP2_MOEAP|nr:hypothetical protein PaG_03215 [Moesziomyces aphidis]
MWAHQSARSCVSHAKKQANDGDIGAFSDNGQRQATSRQMDDYREGPYAACIKHSLLGMATSTDAPPTRRVFVARLSEVVPNVDLREELGDTQGQRPAMTSRPHDLTTIRECFDSTGSLQALTIDPANHPLGCRSSEAILSALMLVMSSESFLIPQAFASVCSECSFQTRNRRCLLLAIVRSVLWGVASDRVGRVEDAFMRGTRCEKAPTLFVGIARPSCKDAHQHQILHVIRPVALGVAQGAGKIAMIPRASLAEKVGETPVKSADPSSTPTSAASAMW